MPQLVKLLIKMVTNSMAYGIHRHSHGICNNSYPKPKQPNSSHFFKVHSNTRLPSTPRPSKNSLSCRSKLTGWLIILLVI